MYYQKSLKYQDVRYQFELNPKPGLLVDAGFLPEKKEEDTDDGSGSGSGGGSNDIESSVVS
ncbi:hypothetical protein EON65_02435 [archaeon]|nr:MAG: hypothetical protein EON65_02435 [archaeon]